MAFCGQDYISKLPHGDLMNCQIIANHRNGVSRVYIWSKSRLFAWSSNSNQFKFQRYSWESTNSQDSESSLVFVTSIGSGESDETVLVFSDGRMLQAPRSATEKCYDVGKLEASTISSTVVAGAGASGQLAALLVCANSLIFTCQMKHGDKWAQEYNETLATINPTSGNIFKIEVSSKLLDVIFGFDYAVRNKKSSDLTRAYVITLESGRVLAVNPKMKTKLVHLCHLSALPVFVGTLSDNLFFILKSGQVAVAHISPESMKKQPRFKWTVYDIPLCPITCCQHGPYIFVGDGSILLASRLEMDDTGKMKMEWKQTSIGGAVKVFISYDFLCVLNQTGRVHVRKCKEILQNIEESAGSLPRAKSKSLQEIVENIQSCSEIIQQEGNELSHINTYIEQLGVAQLLSSGIESFFRIDFNVESSRKSNEFLARVNLSCDNSKYTVTGKWWQLKITYPSTVGEGNMLFDVDSFKEGIRTLLTLPKFQMGDLIKRENMKSPSIGCSLILLDFDRKLPVCCIPLAFQEIDAIHMMQSANDGNRIASNPNSFYDILKNMNPDVNNKMENRVNVVPALHKVLCVLPRDNAWLSLFNKILAAESRGTEDPDRQRLESLKESKQGHLWFQGCQVEIHTIPKENQTVEVVLEGQNIAHLIALKIAIEKRVKKRGGQVTRDIIISHNDIIKQCQQMLGFLDFEQMSHVSVASVMHVYRTFNRISSYFPVH